MIHKYKKGQAVVESILIMVVLFGLTMLVFNTMKKQEWMNKIVPSKYLKGMARAGVWKVGDDAIANHPSIWRRHRMNKGKKVKK